MSAGGFVAAQIAANSASAQASAQKNALAPFVEGGAFGPGDAIDWRPQGDADLALVKSGVLKELRPGRYWYDKQAEASQHQGLTKVIFLLLGLLVLGGLVLIATA